MQRTLADIVVVATPKIAGGVGTLLANIILLRYLGPEQFGLYSICVTAIILSEAILGSPFDIAVIRLSAKYIETREKYALTIEKLALVLKLAILVILLFSGYAILSLLNRPIVESRIGTLLILISALVVAAMLLQRTILTHLQVRQQFMRYGGTDMIQILIKFGGIGLLVLLFTPTPASLLVFFALGPLLSAMFGASFYCQKLFTSTTQSGEASRELWNYSKWYLMTIGLGALIGRLDILMLGWMAPLSAVGVFSVGQILAQIPELLGAYMAIIFSPRIIAYCRNGAFRPFLIKVLLILITMAITGYFLVLGMWDFIALNLLPESYSKSAQIMLLLLPGTLAGMIVIPVALPFVMFVNKRLILTMDCILLPLLITLYYYIIPSYGAEGAAIITTLVHLSRSAVVLLTALYWSNRNELFADMIDNSPQ